MSKGPRVKRSGWKHPVETRSRRRRKFGRPRRVAAFRFARLLLTERELDLEARQ
jgi:hypothetical protein